MRAGLIGTDAYLEEWRRDTRACGDDLDAEVAQEADWLDAAYTDDVLARLVQARRKGDRVTETRAVVADEGGRDRLRPAVRRDRRANQSDGPQEARRGDGGRQLRHGRRRRDRAGRGGRADARRQRGHPARRRAGDPRAHGPARPVDHGRAALDRLLDRRGARGGPRRLPGQGARQLGHRRGRADGARAPARRAPRSGGRRDLERRDGDQRGPGRPLRGRREDRLARRGPRHSRARTSSSTRS